MVITYSLSLFDKTRAASGELCVMVAKSLTITASTKISNVTAKTGEDGNVTSYEANAQFKGAGICRMASPTVFAITIDSTTYTFNDKGAALSLNAQGWKLVMGAVSGTAATTGSLVGSNTSVAITRGSGDNAKWEANTMNGSFQTIVDSLSVRDQFAMEALKGILGHISDPSSLSDSEINFYCNAAYQWAANMMTLAANTRSTISDSTTDVEVQTAEVSSLDNNTEKLLNNIAAAIEKTNSREEVASTTTDETSTGTEGDTGSEEAEETKSYIHKKRVELTSEELMAWLNCYIAHTPADETDTKATVGLDDLIAAIEDNDDYTDIVDAIRDTANTTSLVNAIENIKVTTDNDSLVTALRGTNTANSVYGVISNLSSALTNAIKGTTSNTITACIKEVTEELKNITAELKNIVTAINGDTASDS